MRVPESLPAPSAGQFTATHWSVVLAAAKTPSTLADDALENLCRTYWQPLYIYIRRQGLPPAEAEDLTQEFFARLVQKRFLADVHPLKGRFRCFLLAALKHFLANEWDRARAEKRGGKHIFISLDNEPEGGPLMECLASSSPEQAFDRQWALNVMDSALRCLKQQYTASGKAQQFEQLKRFLARGPASGEYAALAADMQVPAGTVAVAVHRLRKEYGDSLRAVIAGTVAHPAEIEEEMAYLFRVIAA